MTEYEQELVFDDEEEEYEEYDDSEMFRDVFEIKGVTSLGKRYGDIYHYYDDDLRSIEHGVPNSLGGVDWTIERK